MFNPDFATGRGIRRRRPDFFFLKKFVRCPCIDLTFFVEKVAAPFVSVLAPIAKSGFKGGKGIVPRIRPIVVCRMGLVGQAEACGGHEASLRSFQNDFLVSFPTDSVGNP